MAHRTVSAVPHALRIADSCDALYYHTGLDTYLKNERYIDAQHLKRGQRADLVFDFVWLTMTNRCNAFFVLVNNLV